MEEHKKQETHSLEVKNRQHTRLTGVQDVHSFQESEILLLTEAGKLKIQGEQLHVKGLDLEKGEVFIEGRVNNLAYLSKKKDSGEESLLKKMLR